MLCCMPAGLSAASCNTCRDSNPLVQSQQLTLEQAQPDPVPAGGAVAIEEIPVNKQEGSAEPSQEAGRLQCQSAEPQLGQSSSEAVEAEGNLRTTKQHASAQHVSNLQQVHYCLLCF